MRKVTETDIDGPDFRDDLALKLKDAINSTLKRMTGRGGVEEVLFTELVVQ
jgi:flagellar basal body-associated protein FliL